MLAVESSLFFVFFNLWKTSAQSNDSCSSSSSSLPATPVGINWRGKKKKTFVVLGVGVAPCFLLAWVCSSVSVLRPYCNFSFYHMTCHVQPHRVVTKGFLLHANKGISLPHVGMQNACVSSIKANIFISLQNMPFLYCYPSRHLPHFYVDILAFVLLVVRFQVCMSLPCKIHNNNNILMEKIKVLVFLISSLFLDAPTRPT